LDAVYAVMFLRGITPPKEFTMQMTPLLLSIAG